MFTKLWKSLYTRYRVKKLLKAQSDYNTKVNNWVKDSDEFLNTVQDREQLYKTNYKEYYSLYIEPNL